jgi:tRNA wybutosine-synthesizing protein 4
MATLDSNETPPQAPDGEMENHDAGQATENGHASARDSTGSQSKATRDHFIMDTNNSSIVSKRSVEKLYYAGEPEYFRHFVSKFKRRSPLINRGYWLRMKAIEHTVSRFLAETTAKQKVVINLGCG